MAQNVYRQETLLHLGALEIVNIEWLTIAIDKGNLELEPLEITHIAWLKGATDRGHSCTLDRSHLCMSEPTQNASVSCRRRQSLR